MDHKKVDCAGLASGAVRVHTLATLRITGDRKGKMEFLVVESRAFQLHAGKT